MLGKLFVIGIGPGDPELLTLKAVRVLTETPCICVPRGKEEGSSLALSIVEKAVNISKKELLEAYFPMKKTRNSSGETGHNEELDAKWDETVGSVLGKLKTGSDVAFITLGDPAIYSTFFYLYDKLLEIEPDLNIEFIPGVSSITAAAASAGLSLGLGDEKIAVLPATYAADNLTAMLLQFDTLVLMKVHRVFDRVVRILSDAGLAEKAVYVVRAGMADERIYKDIRKVGEPERNYFSLLLVRK